MKAHRATRKGRNNSPSDQEYHHYLGCLAHASYLIADEKTKTAAVVDPQRDIEQYLADAKAGGYTIKYFFLTHFHADFLAGHIELRNQAGARICLGERAGAEFDHTALKDGDAIEFGDVRIQTMETPGHTPEGISLLVFDKANSDTIPHAVLTGDTLFVGDVGRPDLLASIGVTADELAEMLYHSLDRLRRLPDTTLVYPAHGAGSLCGKSLSKETVSTIGEQKKFNYALQPMPFEQFRDLVTSEQPEAPGYFVYDAIKNRQERPGLESTMKSSLKAISLDDVIRLRDAGAQLTATRSVPLKMLPFNNKNEFLLVLDLNEGTSLERTSAVVTEFEQVLATVPEVTDFISYVGVPGPIDFNGLVRHYYLRQSPNLAEIRINLVGKKQRRQQSHAITLRLRDQLTELAAKHGALVRLVELPPGPPVLASVVAEVYGQPDHRYQNLMDSAGLVAERMKNEPGLVEVDDIREAAAQKLVFVTDQEKAALAGISVADIARTLQIALGGTGNELVRVEHERHPLRINLRLPQELRSSASDLGQLHVRNSSGSTIALAELESWRETQVDQTIYHKNLRPVVYVFAECAGRPPAECIVDIQADQNSDGASAAEPESATARLVNGRTYFTNGSGLAWTVPNGIDVVFSGKGEWKITLDVFRDLGLAFAAAMVMIYIILVAQTGSFALPIVVMMAIPLTVIGVMPGFWMLNAISGSVVGGYADPVYFTATAMIGMIALAGIVTRDSIILVDFIELAIRHGRPLFDAILERRVVRLRPILLTAGAALLSSIPITLDPIFSGRGWSLIFGLISSTLFVIPVSYWLLKAND